MGRPRSRLDMRREYEAAEQLEATEDEAGAVVETPEGEAEPKAKKTTNKLRPLHAATTPTWISSM